MKKVGIIGATGYAGLEIARILLNHPEVEISAVSSVSFTGQELSQVYPSMRKLLDKPLCDDKKVVDKCDVVFASLPHGLSEDIAADCYKKGKLFIDMGADFRLESEDDYSEWYGGSYKDKDLHKQAVYGLPELFRDEIKTAKIIANPGCYPTSVILGLAPLLKNGVIGTNSLIIDAKSGVTGAGRSLTQNTHYPELNENLAPYKIAEHRHTPEIEQIIAKVSGTPAQITFVPHLLPINRGILSTIYILRAQPMTVEAFHKLYMSFYENEKFVRVLPLGESVNLKNVKYSNFCDISLHMDVRGKRLIIASTLDNMVKGAAGQAVQNMNIMLGLKEDLGLAMIPPAF